MFPRLTTACSLALHCPLTTRLCPPAHTPRTLLTANAHRPPRSTRRTSRLCRPMMRCAPLRQSQLHFLCLDCDLCLQPAHHCITISTHQRSHSNHFRLQRVTLGLMLRVVIAGSSSSEACSEDRGTGGPTHPGPLRGATGGGRRQDKRGGNSEGQQAAGESTAPRGWRSTSWMSENDQLLFSSAKTAGRNHL